MPGNDRIDETAVYCRGTLSLRGNTLAGSRVEREIKLSAWRRVEIPKKAVKPRARGAHGTSAHEAAPRGCCQRVLPPRKSLSFFALRLPSLLRKLGSFASKSNTVTRAHALPWKTLRLDPSPRGRSRGPGRLTRRYGTRRCATTFSIRIRSSTDRITF